MATKTKEDLIKMLESLPDGAIIKIENGTSVDGTQDSSHIDCIEFDDWNGVYIIFKKK